MRKVFFDTNMRALEARANEAPSRCPSQSVRCYLAGSHHETSKHDHTREASSTSHLPSSTFKCTWELTKFSSNQNAPLLWTSVPAEPGSGRQTAQLKRYTRSLWSLEPTNGLHESCMRDCSASMATAMFVYFGLQRLERAQKGRLNTRRHHGVMMFMSSIPVEWILFCVFFVVGHVESGV